jgi:hypothetical protein
MVNGTIVTATSTSAHVLVAIGYNTTGLFIHDPSRIDKQPCIYYENTAFTQYWNWKGSLWGMEVRAKPSQVPSYGIRISPSVFETIYLDGKKIGADSVRLHIGTAYNISIDSTATVKENSTRTVLIYTCNGRSLIVVGWMLDTKQISFPYTVETELSDPMNYYLSIFSIMLFLVGIIVVAVLISAKIKGQHDRDSNDAHVTASSFC